jgi:hypothetical protein
MGEWKKEDINKSEIKGRGGRRDEGADLPLT